MAGQYADGSFRPARICKATQETDMDKSTPQPIRWTIDRGIGHQVIAIIDGGLYTLCETYGPGNMTAERPKRICRKCRAALALAKETP